LNQILAASKPPPKQAAVPIQLLSTDFDGTLFAEFESPPVPKQLQALIGNLQSRGVKWAINTGREMSSLMEALARAGIEIEPDFLILVEREIHLHQQSQYVPLEEWNSACTRAHAGVFEQVRRDLSKLVDWINSRFHTRIYEDPYSPLCLVAGNNVDMNQIHAFLEAYCRTVPRLTVVRNDVYARFSHEAYNKGTALAELTRRLGLGPEQVFAIGDHLNDLPMLSPRFARFLAAPANAVEPVKAAVRAGHGYLSARTHGRGVAEAIKYYLETAPASH
jgi:hydroxymethylpyrimidine pyrophosphatase-like HAD family hydrolase